MHTLQRLQQIYTQQQQQAATTMLLMTKPLQRSDATLHKGAGDSSSSPSLHKGEGDEHPAPTREMSPPKHPSARATAISALPLTGFYLCDCVC